MADLVVKDLGTLANDLGTLIGEFEGALDFQNDDKHKWGQWNANASMGDFADNWTCHRDDIVKAMKELKSKVEKADNAWASADKQMYDSLNKKK